jgi:hypothetical protein
MDASQPVVPRPRLFVHVGPPKTGTSAIQHVLRTHDDSSVVYPKVGLWRDGAHHNLVFNFFEDFARPEVERADAAGLFAAIGAHARATRRNVVISSEALIGRDVGAFTRALVPYLGMAPADAAIIVVCREHFGRAASLYNQRVKDPFYNETRSPGTYLRQSASGLCYMPMLEQLTCSGVAVEVINYHPAQDLVPRFLRHVGFNAQIVPAGEARNTSMSVKGLVATLAINTLARDGDHRAALFDVVRRMRQFYASSRFIFDHDAAAKVAPVFDQDRDALRRAHGIALPTIELGEQTDMFCLTRAERDDIAAVCGRLGEDGDRIAAFADNYAAERFPSQCADNDTHGL